MTSVASRRRDHEDSGEYSDASQDIEHNNSENDGGQHESDYDSQGSDSERSDQDSENKETERRVDDDEDRSNPQYIPKRGTFYEHDDRTAASGEESSNATSEVASEKKEGSEPGTERRRLPRKSEIVNKWSHDKYNENEQMPKSRDELVAIYGYDIRNEDAPPHARRNRRYGRGPNKYTRTWEDEEAYRRQAGQAASPQQAPRKPPTAEDFPELDPTKRQRAPRGPRPRSKSQPAPAEGPAGAALAEGAALRRNASIKLGGRKPPPKQPAPPRATARPRETRPPPRDTMPPLENLTITANANNNQGQAQRKVNATVAQQRPVPTDQGKKKPTINTQPPAQTNSLPNNKSPPQQQQQKPQQQQQPAAGGGSKRYSSLRQRPLAESYSPKQPQTQQQPQQQQQQQPPQQQQQTQQQPPQQTPQQQQAQQHRYHAGPGEFVAGPALAPNAQQHTHPQHIIHQQMLANAAASHAGHAASPPAAAPPPLPLHAQQQLASVPHPHHNLHNIPAPHTMGQIQPAQGYAPPAMMPAQYMQQIGGAMFPAAPHPAPHAAPHPAPPHAAHALPHAAHAPHAPPHAPPHATYPHQIYTPHHNYATQAGGVTYYNCAEQEPPPAPRSLRRPTAAIPIVSPHHADRTDRPANSSEKDNIDRIVENMFVRKPWPTTHGADSKEKQSENRSSQEPASKESSQPNSLTSSSISTDSKPSESREEKSEEVKVEEKVENETQESVVPQESIATDA